MKQNEDCEEMLKTGSLANVLCVESWGKKHMKTISKSRKRRNSCGETSEREEKAKDVIELLKMLENI